MTTLTLIGKPDCHLCDVAREVVDAVLLGLPDDVAECVTVREQSIHDDAALYAQWWEKIPVILVDDQLVGHWRIAPDRLRAALVTASAR